VVLRVRFEKRTENPQVMLAVTTEDGLSAFRYTASRAEERAGVFEAGTVADLRVGLDVNLVAGNYFLSGGLYDAGSTEFYAWKERALSFFCVGTPVSNGVAELNAKLLRSEEVHE
jgi:hypothetical protein